MTLAELRKLAKTRMVDTVVRVVRDTGYGSPGSWNVEVWSRDDFSKSIEIEHELKVVAIAMAAGALKAMPRRAK